MGRGGIGLLLLIIIMIIIVVIVVIVIIVIVTSSSNGVGRGLRAAGVLKLTISIKDLKLQLYINVDAIKPTYIQLICNVDINQGLPIYQS